MLDVSAVAILVGKLTEERTESTTESRSSSSAAENFVAALLMLSHESLRFKKIAKEASAVEDLRALTHISPEEDPNFYTH
ncbi:unnamed protein product [Brassica oleracea var. botrytis]